MLQFAHTEIDLSGLIDGFTYTEVNAPDIELVIDSGSSLPYMIIEYNDMPWQHFDTVKKGKTFEFTITTKSQGKVICKFQVMQYKFTSGNLVVIAQLDNLEYTHKRSSGYFEGTSVDAIKDLITTLDVKVECPPTEDEMIWLRHNQTDKEFLKHTLLHTFYPSNTAVLSYINLKSELLLTDLKTVSKFPPKVIFGNTPGKVRYEQIMIESSPIALSDFTLRNFGLSVQNGSTDNYEDESEDEINSYKVLDCGNVYPDYYTSVGKNMKLYTQLMSRTYVIPFPSDDLLYPGDPVQIEMVITPDNSGVDAFNKTMIVLKNKIAIKPSGITQNLQLYDITFLNGTEDTI